MTYPVHPDPSKLVVSTICFQIHLLQISVDICFEIWSQICFEIWSQICFEILHLPLNLTLNSKFYNFQFCDNFGSRFGIGSSSILRSRFCGRFAHRLVVEKKVDSKRFTIRPRSEGGKNARVRLRFVALPPTRAVSARTGTHNERQPVLSLRRHQQAVRLGRSCKPLH